MLNFNRNDRPGDARPTETKGLKPPMPMNATTVPSTASVGRYTTGGTSMPSHAPTPPSTSTLPPAPTSHEVHDAPAAGAAPSGGAKLIVGRNVKLKGVEISDCEMVVVEGQVEASVTAKGMQIAKPGTLKGNAVIDIAEIDGDFTGELTAHTKLVVNGTGRVSGTIRYGSLIVAEGGEITGDVKRIDDATPALRQPIDARPPTTHGPGR
ncbi:MAG: polymer-forming cytoskeletal protein [Betaproteobacteria bacterium]